MNQEPKKLGESDVGRDLSIVGNQTPSERKNILETKEGKYLPLGTYRLKIMNNPEEESIKDGTLKESERGYVAAIVRVLNEGWTERDVACYAAGQKFGNFAPNRINSLVELNDPTYEPLAATEKPLPAGYQPGKIGIELTTSDETARAQQTRALGQNLALGEYTITGSYDALWSPERMADSHPKAVKQVYSVDIACMLNVGVKGMNLRDLCFLAAGTSSMLYERELVGTIRIDSIKFKRATKDAGTIGQSGRKQIE